MSHEMYRDVPPSGEEIVNAYRGVWYADTIVRQMSHSTRSSKETFRETLDRIVLDTQLANAEEFTEAHEKPLCLTLIESRLRIRDNTTLLQRAKSALHEETDRLASMIDAVSGQRLHATLLAPQKDALHIGVNRDGDRLNPHYEYLPEATGLIGFRSNPKFSGIELLRLDRPGTFRRHHARALGYYFVRVIDDQNGQPLVKLEIED